MGTQAGIVRALGHRPPVGVWPGTLLGTVLVLVATLAAAYFSVFGGLNQAFGIIVPVAAWAVGLLGVFAPRFTLSSLFVCAPILWAFQDNIFQGSERVNLPMVAGFLIVVAFTPEMLVNDPDANTEKIRKLLLVFAFACIPAIFSAASFLTGTGVYLRIMCPFIVMFAVARHTRDEHDILRYIKSMALSLAATAATMLIAYSQSTLWVSFGGFTRLGAFHSSPQLLGEYLSVMVAVVMLGYLLTRNKLYLTPIPFMLGAIYLTFFRTAWIGAALLLVLFAFAVKKAYGLRLLVVLGMIVAAAHLASVRTSLIRYETNVDSVSQANQALSGRLSIDTEEFENYLDAPFYHKFFGIGFYQGLSVSKRALRTAFMVHDDYLAMLVEAGVFAALLYITLLGLLVRRSIAGMRATVDRVPRMVSVSALALLVSFIIMGLPGCWYTQVLPDIYAFSLMGLMLGMSRMTGPWEKLPSGVSDSGGGECRRRGERSGWPRGTSDSW